MIETLMRRFVLPSDSTFASLFFPPSRSRSVSFPFPFSFDRSVIVKSVGLFRLAGDGVDRAILRSALDDGNQVGETLTLRSWDKVAVVAGCCSS